MRIVIPGEAGISGQEVAAPIIPATAGISGLKVSASVLAGTPAFAGVTRVTGANHG